MSNDNEWVNKITAEFRCENCTTDVKKYNEYIIEDLLNGLKAEKKYINQPFTFTMVIKEFGRGKNQNPIDEGGIGGRVGEGQFKYDIAVYGIPKDDLLKLNLGDTVRFTGNLIHTDSGSNGCGRFISYGDPNALVHIGEAADYCLIRLVNGIIIK